MSEREQYRESLRWALQSADEDYTDKVREPAPLTMEWTEWRRERQRVTAEAVAAQVLRDASEYLVDRTPIYASGQEVQYHLESFAYERGIDLTEPTP